MRIRFGRNVAVAALTCAVLLVTALTVLADDPPQYSGWSAPVNLGPTVNTSGNDSGPCISHDGLTLYFNSNSLGGYGGLDIFVSHRASVNDPWGTPQNLGPNVNSSGNDNAPALSPDEHWLYFQSGRPGYGGSDLYVARRHNKTDDFGWQAAKNLGSINTSANEGGPVYFEDDATGITTLYFFSNRPGGLGGTDIYASTLQSDDTWSTPVLVNELSSPFTDTQPAIRRDGLEIFVTSDRPGSISSLGDIWVSTRETTSAPWSPPITLGPAINSPAPYSQGRPSISFDGTTMYFYSTRAGGYGQQDLYVSTRTKLRN